MGIFFSPFHHAYKTAVDSYSEGLRAPLKVVSGWWQHRSLWYWSWE